MQYTHFQFMRCPLKHQISNSRIRFITVCALALILSSSLFSLRIPVTALAKTDTATQHALRTNGCSTQTVPDKHSFLVVLLDRSGSMGLNGPNSGTDPYNYSASVTDALADLWIGPIAVIIFSGSGTKTIISVNPIPTERASLKQQINASTANGYTPMDLAFQNAQNLLRQQGYPAGSRIVLITDGYPQTASDPDGTKHEIPDILTNLAPQLSRKCIAVNAFGLSANQNAQDKVTAHNFLQQVTTSTNGIYRDVPNTTALADAVISLYAQWRELEFQQINEVTVNNNYPLVLDSSFQQASIITFHSGNFTGQNRALTTKSGQNIPPSEIVTLTGNHYQIDTLLSPIPADTYFVDTGSDPQAFVYALVKSTRTLQIVQPSGDSTASAGQTLSIQVHLVDQGIGPVIPSANEQKIFQAIVTGTIHGKPQTWTINLQPRVGSDIFAGNFTVPQDAKPGDKLEISGNSKYQGINHTTKAHISITIVLIKPETFRIILFGLLALLSPLVILALLLFIRSRTAPIPYGYLVRADDSTSILNLKNVAARRSHLKRFFYPSTLTIKDLIRSPRGKTVISSLSGESLVLKFTRKGLTVAGKTTAKLTIMTDDGEQQLTNQYVLKDSNELRYNSNPICIFHTSWYI